MAKSETTPVVLLIIFIFATLLFGLLSLLRYNELYEQEKAKGADEYDPETKERIWGLKEVVADRVEQYRELKRERDQLQVQLNGKEYFIRRVAQVEESPGLLDKDSNYTTHKKYPRLQDDPQTDSDGGVRDQARSRTTPTLLDDLGERRKKTAYEEVAGFKELYNTRDTQYKRGQELVEQENRNGMQVLRGIESKEDGEFSERDQDLRGQVTTIQTATTEERAKEGKPKEKWDAESRPLKSEVSTWKDQIKQMTARDPRKQRHVFLPDGKVVRVNEPLNMVTINIGGSLGVKPGFIFEVYNWEQGHQRVSKGYLEVKKVDAGTAVCTIISKLGRFPRDPASDWVAPGPEALFSPFSVGRTESAVQKLTGTPMRRMWIDAMHPIVEDDLIHNPFFEQRSRVVTVQIEPEEANFRNSLYKDKSIRYRKDEIERQLRAYGHKVVQELTPDCHYAIFSKLHSPVTRDAEKKAMQLGIPIIREWELFRFMDDGSF